MVDVVPHALKNLRAADIIRKAGLAGASKGQEYYRSGAVSATARQGIKLSGIVDTSHIRDDLPTPTAVTGEQTVFASKDYPVEVEIHDEHFWLPSCPCTTSSTLACQHVAALLYAWLAHPEKFSVSSLAVPRIAQKRSIRPSGRDMRDMRDMRDIGDMRITRDMAELTGNIAEILSQLGLSELRNIAREYDISPSEFNKQQLPDAILAAMKQPEAVRKVVSTLDKPQRQLLATLTLAGGNIPDEDLRSLFERFSFGKYAPLQEMLIALQNKGVLFRIHMSNPLQQRLGLSSLSSSLLDIGWYVPEDVRAALRVTMPITVYDVEAIAEGEASPPTIQHVEPYAFLADLLLIGRAMDDMNSMGGMNGSRLASDEEKEYRRSLRDVPRPSSFRRETGNISENETGIVAPPPEDRPAPSVIERLEAEVQRSSAFLRFAIALLRHANILRKDDTDNPDLHLISNATQLLAGSSYVQTARDLFEHWLTSSSYEELYDLQEGGVRLRCRTLSYNVSEIRSGELDVENAAARQILVELISKVPRNQWVSFPAFLRFIYRLNPYFLQFRQRAFPTPHWWLEQENGQTGQTGKPGQVLKPLQPNDWMRAEGRYLTQLIREPLRWFGICELALSADDRLLAFKLTPLANWFLNDIHDIHDTRDIHEMLSDEHTHEEQTATSDDGSSIQVVSTDEILLTCNLANWPAIALLEDFAEKAGVRNGRLRYRLTPPSLSEALSRGKQAAVLIAWLHTLAEQEVIPDSPLIQMMTQIEQWTNNYGRIRVYTGVSLLEVADTLTMRELSATTSVQEYIMQPISPTLMILKKQPEERFIEQLKRRGHVPLMHEKDDDGTE